MQEPLERVFFNFPNLLAHDTDRASVPASIADSFYTGDPFHGTASGSLSSTLFSAESLELFPLSAFGR